MINILSRMVLEYRDNCKGYPKSMNPDNNKLFDTSMDSKWKDVLSKIANYFREASSDRCHWQNRFRSGSKKYMIEQEKIDSYRAKCLHKALRILDFYIEEMHQVN